MHKRAKFLISLSFILILTTSMINRNEKIENNTDNKNIITIKEKIITENKPVKNDDNEQSKNDIIEDNEQSKNDIIEGNDKEEDNTVTDEKNEDYKIIEDDKEYINFVLSFYGTGESQNGKWGDVNAIGQPLSYGMIASNNFKLGTRIHLEDIGIFEVLDTGNPKYIKKLNHNTYKIDLFIPQRSNETYDEYIDRIYEYGLYKVKGYIVE